MVIVFTELIILLSFEVLVRKHVSVYVHATSP